MTDVRKCLQPNSRLEADGLSLRNSIAGSIESTSVTIQNPLPVSQNVHIEVRCPTTGTE
ncbi:hypothetical protein ACTXT7_016807, partial [Hymenolepis weldensis]